MTTDIPHQIDYQWGLPARIDYARQDWAWVYLNIIWDCRRCGTEHKGRIEIRPTPHGGGNTYGKSKRWRFCKECKSEHRIDLDLALIAKANIVCTEES